MIITNSDLRFLYNKIKEYDKYSSNNLMSSLLIYTPYRSFFEIQGNHLLTENQKHEQIENALSHDISFDVTQMNNAGINFVEGLCNNILYHISELLLSFINYKGVELLQEMISNNMSQLKDYNVPQFKKSNIKYSITLLSRFVIKNYNSFNNSEISNNFLDEIASLTRYCVNEKNKDTKTKSLILINELIKKNYNKDIVIELINEFIKNSSLLNGKAKNLFEKILNNFSDEEIKLHFPLNKIKDIHNISNALYEEREVKAYIIKINLFKIENTTHRGIIRKNMKSYMSYMNNILGEMPGYCFSTSKSSEELVFNVAVEKDKGEIINELHKKILNTILETNDIVTLDWLKKVRQVFLLNKTLDSSLTKDSKMKKSHKI